MNKDDAYTDVMEQTAKKYGPKALALLARIREICLDAGITSDNAPYDMPDDMYCWCLTVSRLPGSKELPDEDSDLIDITVEIAEEREYERGNGYGLSFGISVVEYGGKILGSLKPYNFTSDVWVDARSPDDVAARWRILEDTDLSEIPDLTDKNG